jgi:hypothetical protein
VSRVYELPTHLQVEDDVILGLSVRQLVRLSVGASLAYGVWDQAQWLPDRVRLSLTVVVTVIGAVCAVVQPKGRPIDQWALAAVRFAIEPRRLGWHAAAPRSSCGRVHRLGRADAATGLAGPR